MLGNTNVVQNCIKNENPSIKVEKHISDYFINSIDELRSAQPDVGVNDFSEFLDNPTTFSMYISTVSESEVKKYLKMNKSNAVG